MGAEVTEAVARRCSVKEVLRNFAKFTGKHLCQSLFFNKVAGLRPFLTEHLRWLLLKLRNVTFFKCFGTIFFIESKLSNVCFNLIFSFNKKRT